VLCVDRGALGGTTVRVLSVYSRRSRPTVTGNPPVGVAEFSGVVGVSRSLSPSSPGEGTLAAVAGGRADVVAELRSLADRIEHLALADAAEVLVLLEPALSDLWRQTVFALEPAPGLEAGGIRSRQPL
jgi:hypothetical protein